MCCRNDPWRCIYAEDCNFQRRFRATLLAQKSTSYDVFAMVYGSELRMLLLQLPTRSPYVCRCSRSRVVEHLRYGMERGKVDEKCTSSPRGGIVPWSTRPKLMDWQIAPAVAEKGCYPGPMRGMSWCSLRVDRYLFNSSTRSLCVLTPSRINLSSSCDSVSI